MNLRVRPDKKRRLCAWQRSRTPNLTDFVLQPTLREAEAIIKASDHLEQSTRGSLRVLELLENPLAANDKFRAAAIGLTTPA